MADHENDDMYDGLGFKSNTTTDDSGAGNEGQAASQNSGASATTPALPSTKDVFGAEFEYDDWEKVKVEVPQAFKQAKEYQEKLNEIEQLKALNSNPFANEEVAKWNSFIKKTGITDISTFNTVKSLDLASSDPIEIMVLDEVIANPKLLGSEEAIREDLRRRHGLDPSEVSQDIIKLNTERLSKVVEPIREKLKGLQNFEQYSPVTPEAVEAARNQRFEEYKPKIVNAVSGLQSIPLIATAGDGKETPLLDFAVSADDVASASERMAKLFASQGLEVNEKTLPNIQAAIRNDVILSNVNKMVHAAWVKGRQDVAREYDIQLDNPSALKGGQSGEAPKGATKGSFEEQLLSE